MIKLNTALPPLRAFIQGLNDVHGSTFTEKSFTHYDYAPNEDKLFNTKITLELDVMDNKYEGLKDITYRRPSLSEVLTKQLGVPVVRIDIESIEKEPTVDDVRLSMKKYYRLEVTNDMISIDNEKNEVTIDNIAYFGTMRYNIIMGRIALKDHIPAIVDLIDLEKHKDLSGNPEALFKRLLVEATLTEDFILNWAGVEIKSLNDKSGMPNTAEVVMSVPEDHPRYLPGTNTVNYVRPTWQDVAFHQGFEHTEAVKVPTYANNLETETAVIIKDLETMLKLPTSVKDDWSLNDISEDKRTGKLGINHYILSDNPLGLVEVSHMKIDIKDVIVDENIDMFEI